MWKKRLIITVTFIAGLYYFLEFLIPPMVPWATTRGVVQKVTIQERSIASTVKDGEPLKAFTARVKVGMVEQTGSALVDVNSKITRISNTGAIEQIPSDAVRPGDMLEIEQPKGEKLSGIALPSSSSMRIDVGNVTRTKTVLLRYAEHYDARTKANVLAYKGKQRLRRMLSKDAGEDVMPDADTLKAGVDRSASWVEVGPTTYLSSASERVTDFFAVLGAMAWGMGLLSLWLVHSANIRKRRPEWYTSVIFFISVLVGLLAGVGLYQANELGRWAWTIPLNYVIVWNVLRPLGSTVFSLLTFYLASAAYRSFKAETYEGALMMVSAVIVMVGQVSLNVYVTKGSTWILYIINNAAVRGMWFGMMLGGIAIGLRMWLSLERGAFFDREL